MAAEHDRRPRVPMSPEAGAAAEDGIPVSSAADSAPDPPAEEALAQEAGVSPSPADNEAGEVRSASDEDRLERDLEEIVEKADKAEQYLELARRTKADFENYRRRAAREAASAQQRGIVKLAQELLPAVDDLDRAVAAAPAGGQGDDGGATLVSGIKLVHAGVIAALARVGIEPYSPLGERFDPQYHEAVAQQPVQGAQPGVVVEVYQRGYRLPDGSVLRPARVVVAA